MTDYVRIGEAAEKIVARFNALCREGMEKDGEDQQATVDRIYREFIRDYAPSDLVVVSQALFGLSVILARIAAQAAAKSKAN